MNYWTIFFLLMTLVGCRTLGNIPISNINIPSGYNSYAPKKYKKATGKQYPQNFLKQFDYSTSKFATKVVTKNEPPNKDCSFIKKHRTTIQTSSEELSVQYLQRITSYHFANYLHIINIEEDRPEMLVEGDLYLCSHLPKRNNNTHKDKDGSSIEVDLLFGSYIKRIGFLDSLGDPSPTVGITFSKFQKKQLFQKTNVNLGWYLHFNIDHFSNTNSEYLRPKFSGHNYTNYLWSYGAAFNYQHSMKWRFIYSIGPAINFLEIDTTATDETLTNEEAIRTTLSLVHQLSIFHKSLQNKRSFGINLLYYWMPHPLGEFADNNIRIDSYAGGSYALMFAFKF